MIDPFQIQKQEFASWASFIPESEIRRLLEFDVPHYYGGGKPGMLPTDVFARILIELGTDQLTAITHGNEMRVIDDLNYGPTGGYQFFRTTLANRLRDKDNLTFLDKDEGWKDVIITTGSQQALYAILDSLVNPGDTIITPRPAYLGFLVPAVKLGAEIISVPSDLDGIIPEYIETAIKLSKEKFDRVPKAIYVVADSDNPKGTTVPQKRRQAIFDIAEEHKILIIEDAAYKEIQFKKRYIPIKSLDKENERVAYLSSSSKEAVVLRTGYSVMPEKLAELVIKDKGFLDLCTPTLVQRILDLYYSKYIDDALPSLLEEYKRRMDTMGRTIDETFPPGVRTAPTGGFFFWWESEDISFNATKFLEEKAIPSDVLYVPGAAFYPIRGHSVIKGNDNELVNNIINKNTMRLSFSYKDPANIRVGMSILGRLLSRELG
ncbi:MAG: PLP-dependent aminotransferase family protein [Candidatus Hodarchaeota archaeon]